MKTKPESQECSVVVAFAELGRLERDRAERVAAKRALRERLDHQARELASLRERLEAERPRAIARVRRERARRERVREQLTARLIAEAETAHDERLELIRAELEAKRLRLAALEASEPVVRPSRRWLEWSVPVAASALVAFLGFTLFDEEQAVAQTAPVEQVEVKVEPAAAPEPVAEPVVEPEPEPEPEPVAPEPEPEPEAKPSKPVKKSTSKKSTPTKKTTDESKPKPVIEKNKNPLKLGDFGGNPLG